jgi:hypothetical protein
MGVVVKVRPVSRLCPVQIVSPAPTPPALSPQLGGYSSEKWAS